MSFSTTSKLAAITGSPYGLGKGLGLFFSEFAARMVPALFQDFQREPRTGALQSLSAIRPELGAGSAADYLRRNGVVLEIVATKLLPGEIKKLEETL
jgi:hypothetical protein